MLNNIALLLFLSPTLSIRSYVYAYNWYGYPACAQPQLQLAAPPSCDTGVVQTTNECLCFDTSYLTTAAQYIGKACECAVLTTSAGFSEAYCVNSVGGTSLNANQFVAAGGVCSSSSTTSSTTAQSTTTATTSSASSPNTSTSSSSSVTSALATITTSPSGPPSPQTSTPTPSGYDKNDSPKADAIALGIGIPTLFFTILGICWCNRTRIAARS